MRLLPFLGAAAVLTASGVVHGLWTDRWGADDLPAAAARLGRVPYQIGDWKGAPAEVDALMLAQAEAAGHLSRKYVNPSTGAEVSVLVVCGRTSAIAVHTPDICYVRSGYTPVGEVARQPLGGSAEAYTARFISPGAAP